MGSVKISQYTGDLSADSGSFNHITVTGNIQGGLPSGLISSSTQIDTNFFDIDGLVSSSTQIDDLGFLKVSGDSVLSSSAQIASDISGSGFTPSLSTDVTARNITASGDISASGDIYTTQLYINNDDAPAINSTRPAPGFGLPGELNVGGWVTSQYNSVTPTHNTRLTGQNIDIIPSGGFQLSSHTDSDTALYVNYEIAGTKYTKLFGSWEADDISLTSITASGAISASGDITANSFIGTVTTATTASYISASNIDGIIDISDQTNLVDGTNLTLSGDTLNLDTNISLTDITASGDIVPSGVAGNIKYKLSASGDIIATTLKIKDFFFGSFDADTLRITYDGDYILEVANDSDIDEVKIFKPTEIVGNVSASGKISAFGSSSLSGLPTSEPSITGALWISGSSEAHPNSGYLMVFNP